MIRREDRDSSQFAKLGWALSEMTPRLLSTGDRVVQNLNRAENCKNALVASCGYRSDAEAAEYEWGPVQFGGNFACEA